MASGIVRWKPVSKAATKGMLGNRSPSMRIALMLQCEATARLEPKAKGLPDMVFRLRVVKSDLRYDGLVVEHVPGLGGSAAKLLGDAAQASVKHWHPSLERHLLDKANSLVIEGVKDRVERYVASLSLPTMVFFAFGILLPVMMFSLVPLLTLGSVSSVGTAARTGPINGPEPAILAKC